MIQQWGASARHVSSLNVLCEGSHRWMREHAFVIDRKFLLKLEKRFRKFEKLNGMKEMLFTTSSGWILQENTFNLDGAEPLE